MAKFKFRIFPLSKGKKKKKNWKMAKFSNFSETKENKIWKYSWISFESWFGSRIYANLNLNFQR